MFSHSIRTILLEIGSPSVSTLLYITHVANDVFLKARMIFDSLSAGIVYSPTCIHPNLERCYTISDSHKDKQKQTVAPVDRAHTKRGVHICYSRAIKA